MARIFNRAQGLSGLNPLAYMGVQGAQNNNTVMPFVSFNTDPTVNDWQNFSLGTIWLRPDTEKAWMLVSLAENQATWVEFTAGAGSILGIINTDGNLAITTAAQIATVNFAPNITVTGSGATITLSSSTASGATNPKIIFGSSNNIISFFLNNVFLGSNAGNTTGTGIFNIGIGPFATASYTTGQQNIGIGNGALENVTTGTANCAFGYTAGRFLVTGSSNTFLGDGAGASYTTSESSNISIGYGVGGTIGESGVTRIGGGSTNTAYIAGQVVASGSLTASSDSGGIASTTTISNANSAVISTGVGSVKMSTANAATNTAWIKIYIGTTAFWIPAWTTNSP